MTATRQQRTFYRTFSQHGTGSAMVELEPKDVALLVHISYLDILRKRRNGLMKDFLISLKGTFIKLREKMLMLSRN